MRRVVGHGCTWEKDTIACWWAGVFGIESTAIDEEKFIGLDGRVADFKVLPPALGVR